MAKSALHLIPVNTMDLYEANFTSLGCESKFPQVCYNCDLRLMYSRTSEQELHQMITMLIVACTAFAGDSSEHKQINVLFNLIHSPMYEPKIRPNFPVSPAIITLGFYILSIDDLDIKDMGFSVDMFLRQQWYDERLQHDHFTYLDASLFIDQLWIPDTYFVESKRAKFHQVTDKNIMIKVFPNGRVYYSARLSVRISCAMDFRKFPMDVQECPLSIESYGYGKDQIIYQWENKSTFTYTVQNNAISQYDLKPMTLVQQTTQYVIGDWSTLTAVFIFDRKSSIFIPGMYFPCAIVVVISWITFFLEPDHFPARTSLCVTAVLTIVTIEAGINSSLPKVSYVKMIDLYILVCILFVSGAFLEYAIILLIKEKRRKFFKMKIKQLEQSSEKLNSKSFLQTRRKYQDHVRSFCGSAGETVPFMDPSDIFTDPKEELYKDQLRQLQSIEKSSKFYLRDTWPRILDRYSMILFPLFFFIFNFIYWLFLH